MILIDIKMKYISELGHSDHLKNVRSSKINVDPGSLVHSNDLFSKITAPMFLKFHMQDDKVAWLPNEGWSAGLPNSGKSGIKNGRCC